MPKTIDYQQPPRFQINLRKFGKNLKINFLLKSSWVRIYINTNTNTDINTNTNINVDIVIDIKK